MGSEPPPVRAGPRRAGHEGSLEVFVANEQDEVDLDVDRYAQLARFVLQAEGVRGDVESAVLFVDEQFITSLNRKYMGATTGTDVLAFPIDDEFFQTGRSPDGATRRPPGRDRTTGPGTLLLGDVVVCPAVARRQSESNTESYPGHDGSLEAELDLLVTHGILHVLGYGHSAADERSVMQAAERQHLSSFGEQQA